jgi:hypothetical protein
LTGFAALVGAVFLAGCEDENAVTPLVHPDGTGEYVTIDDSSY